MYHDPDADWSIAGHIEASSNKPSKTEQATGHVAGQPSVQDRFFRPQPSREAPLFYKHCSECGDWSYCKHPEDYQPNPRLKTSVSLMANFKPLVMLHPKNLSNLLTENVDEHVSGYLIFTPNGNVLGYSDGTLIKFARKTAALSGLSWRLQEAILRGTDPAAVTNISASPLKVVEFKANASGQALKTMVVECDEMTVVIEYVKFRLLVCTMKALGEDRKMKDGSKEEGMGEEAVSGAEGLQESDDGSAGQDGSVDENSSVESIVSPANSQEPSKLQILKWKAEGMADALRGDLKDFDMPALG